jgi:NodT family efflux transporter outer membrane factor (OMF) lipoprotein
MKRNLAVLTFVLSLMACVPADITPQQVRLAPETLGLGEAPAPQSQVNWWHAFGDAQLDHLMDVALAGNPTLEVALARLRLAQADMTAQRSQLYPQVTFDAQDERQRFSENYIIPPPYGGTWQWMGTVQGNLSWNLDFWGKQAAEVSKAKDLRAAAQLDSETARLAVSGALTQAYIALARAWRLIDIAKDAEQEQQNLLLLTQRRIESGLDSNVEEKKAEALFSRARENRIGAEAARDIVVHEIAAIAGHGADLYPQISRPALDLAATLPLPVALPADLLARRPDILAAKARIDASVSERKSAAAAFYPNVDLLAFAGWQAIGLRPLFNASSTGYGAGPAIDLPIFDAGKLRANYGAATAGLDEAVADYNGALTNAVKETSDALSEIRALDRQSEQERQTLSAADASYRLAQTRYRTGLANQLTVLDAEGVWLAERQADATLAAEGATQRVALLIAVGGGFQPDKVQPPPAEDSLSSILQVTP